MSNLSVPLGSVLGAMMFGLITACSVEGNLPTDATKSSGPTGESSGGDSLAAANNGNGTVNSGGVDGTTSPGSNPPETIPADGGVTPTVPSISDSCDGSNVRHITVAGSGSGDGLSEASAGTFQNLDTFIKDVGPGGQVCFHEGTYSGDTVVSNSGGAGQPVIIKGVGTNVLFKNDFDASKRQKSTAAVFKINGSNLTFSNLKFENVGECFQFSTHVENIVLSKFRASNVSTAVTVTRGGTQSVKGLTISQAMILQFNRGGIFFGANTDGAIVENSYIDMQPEKIGGQGTDYPVGIAIYDATKNIIIRNTTVMHVKGKTDSYTQGDGIDGEVTAQGVKIQNSYFRESQDGCIDIKTPGTVISDTIAIGCKRNFRLWQRATPGPTCERCTSYQPVEAHFFASGGTATVTNVSVWSDNSAVLFKRDDALGAFTINGLKGSLAAAANKNVTNIIDDQLTTYGTKFTLPPIPNPTPFTP